MTLVRPMLGVNVDLCKLKYPVYVSPKLDGVRAVITDDGVYSRSGKLIPNEYTQQLFRQFIGLDGELIVDNPTASDVYRKTVSGVMTKDGNPDVRFYCFDCWKAAGGIIERYNSIYPLAVEEDNKDKHITVIPQKLVINEDELLTFEQKCLEEGYEGIIIRSPTANYKFGRSTINQGALLKLKRFVDAEAEIVGYIPKLHNTNEATKNALGYTERSTAKDGKVETDMLGAIEVSMDGNTFWIGSGFDDSTRKELWNDRANLIGKMVKFKYFTVGVKDKPRFPIFLGFRDRRDL